MRAASMSRGGIVSGVWQRIIPVLAWLVLAFLPTPALAQWNPGAGQWGKSDANHLRVMTWNVLDRLCSTTFKTNGNTTWHSLVVTVAALKPDVLILQETGDNSGNGTGAGVDSVPNLTTTMELFIHGGFDPFRAATVTAYVQLYAPSYDLPYIFVSSSSDGFNRNIIMSRYPFADLNGDSISTISDIFIVTADQCAPGGTGGIRGFQFAEIDLPDAVYQGDAVIGNGHLKAGSTSSDLAERLVAAQNIQYFLYYLFAGGGTSTPDPFSRIRDLPPATSVLSPSTAVIWGGDWNEDELTNGRRGPADYMVNGCIVGGADGTDRNTTDAVFDSATNPFTGSRSTRGGSKLDYIASWDSVATTVRGFIFQSSTIPAGAYPPELLNHPFPANVSTASDHFAVLVDFDLPRAATVPPGAFSLSAPTDGAAAVPVLAPLAWTTSAGASSYTVTLATDPGLANVVATFPGIGSTAFVVPSGVLANSATYFWGATAVNSLGQTASNPTAFSFTTDAAPPPGAFSLISPINNGANVSRQPAFNWDDSSSATSYTLTLARDAALTDVVATIPGLGVSQHTVTTPALDGCTQYHWGVLAFNASGQTASTPASRTFTTGRVADLFPDGVINTNDFFAFLILYQNQETTADINLDGLINTNDFFAFLVAYQAGC